MTMRKDFLERMAIGCDRAKARRDEGGGVAHKSWTRKRAPDPERGSWDRAVAEAQAYFRNVADQAIADLDYALNGDQWEGIS